MIWLWYLLVSGVFLFFWSVNIFDMFSFFLMMQNKQKRATCRLVSKGPFISSPPIDTRARIFSPAKWAEIFHIIDNKFQPGLEMNEKISARTEIAI